MPELPEVETIRRGLKNKVIGKAIREIKVKKPKIVKPAVKQFIGFLQGNKFTDISRVGKLLMIKLASGHYLLIHLKMTGQLIYLKGKDLVAGGHSFKELGELPNKHTHVLISFADGSNLFFNDLRQFGYMQVVDKEVKDKIVGRFGIEPLQHDFTWQNFRQLFTNKSSVLKSFLLDQSIIAGLGNIYVDEVCFRAGVLPQRRINTLTEKELRKIYLACQYIINKAIIKKGTTFRDYRDTEGKSGNFVKYLKVYGRGGEPCLNCHCTINKIKLNGRGTHFCLRCQC